MGRVRAASACGSPWPSTTPGLAVSRTPVTPRSHSRYGAASGSTSRAGSVPEHAALCEIPKPLQVVLQNQAMARQRMDELQAIFTSRNSKACDALREHLASLQEEAAELRAQVTTAEQQLQRATAERIARKPHKGAISVSGVSCPRQFDKGTDEDDEGKGEADLEDNDSHRSMRTDEGCRASRDGLLTPACETPEPEETRSNALQQDHDNLDQKRGSLVQNFTQELISPILFRRRAEARFREASLVHESSLSQMKAEMMEVEHRMQKQQLWIKQVNDQILQAQITKARYNIRSEKAERRVKSLSQDLGQAYAKTKALLEERLSVDNIAARNDALVAYLNVIRCADVENATCFLPNNGELRALLERFRFKTTCRSELDDKMEQLQYRQRLVVDTLKHADQLRQLLEELQALWIKLPPPMKESVSLRAHKASSMPPAFALQTMDAACQILISDQKEYLSMLNKAASDSNHDE